MGNFTKGNWSVGVYETKPSLIERLKKPQACVCIDSPGTADHLGLIALCGDAVDPESKADADLIAAAPDMYEALKAIFQRRAPNFNFDFENAPDMQLLVKAIDKAEGKFNY